MNATCEPTRDRSLICPDVSPDAGIGLPSKQQAARRADPPTEMEGVFVTGADGLPIDMEPIRMVFNLSDVGQDGAEPSIGVTSTGCVFFIAFEKVMRSCDYGETWEDVTGPMCAFQTNDPWGWVDPVTDRIFNVQMQGLETSWICWSDDDGDTWIGNPPRFRNDSNK